MSIECSSSDPELKEIVNKMYDRLKPRAKRLMRSQRTNHTLGATALLHEAMWKVLTAHTPYGDERRYITTVTKAMRDVLCDHARRKLAAKRNPGGHRSEDDLDALPDVPGGLSSEDMLAIDQALTRLEQENAPLAEVVRLRLFGGLTERQTAAVVGRDPLEVRADWARAKLRLKALVSSTAPDDAN